MSEQDYSEERRVFEACLERTPVEREAFLDVACGSDPSYRARIERLLAAHDTGDTTLLPGLDRAYGPGMPEEIGPYTILRVLGEGGMGVVYEAEQREPLARSVALKVIRTGSNSRDVVARFEAERQALAVMDHPNIARVFDAGITESGSPYFVMELVRGVPLLDYSDHHRLTIRERLQLFVPLCLAVQHAHQKGIIHRDLKPANVLVMERDGKPFTKVIDFGVAKAVSQTLVARLDLTLRGQLVGTPAYMSPEQADPSGRDVDTRSDVYSLGVMLYELLLGTLPVDPQEIGVREFLVRLVRMDSDLPVPSAALEEKEERRLSAAAARRVEPERLPAQVRGDLDWIIMKAMEKDRTLRYGSAAELAQDIERHLRDEPVLARPPTTTYRFRKFVLRHKAVVAAAVVAFIALAVGATATTVVLVRPTLAERAAREEAARARDAQLRANQRLRDSLVAQARANRTSRSPGRRYSTLGLLRQAAAIRPGSDLRNEGVAALMLADLRPKAEWPLPDLEQRHLLEFAPDLDRYLVGFVDGRLEIRSASGGPTQFLPATGLPAQVARFSPDGRKVAVKYHGASDPGPAFLRVWDLDSGRVLLSQDGWISGRAVDFSPDSRSVAFAMHDRTLFLRDLASGRLRLKQVLESAPLGLRFRPAGSALALALQGRRILVLGLDGAIRRQIECPAIPTSVDWDGEGRSIGAGLYDFSAAIWDFETGRRVSLLQGHQAEVVDILFDPTAPIVATYSWDETSRLWDLATGREMLVVGARIRRFSKDGSAASFVTRQTAGVWEVLYGDTFRTLHGHFGKSPVSLDFDPNGTRMVSVGPDGGIIWDVETGRTIAALPAGDAKDALFDPKDDSLITCGEEGAVRWTAVDDPRSPSRPHAHPISRKPCAAVAVSATGTTTAVLEASSLRLLLPGGAEERLLEAFPGMLYVDVSPGGEWIAGGNWRGDRAQVWDAKTGSVAVRLLSNTQSVNVRFSPDGNWLATGSSDDYRLWRTGSWKEAIRVPRPKRFSNLPGQLDFSPDSRLLALQVDQTRISVVHVANGEMAWEMEMSEPRAIAALRFSGDGRRLAAAASTNQILVWDLDGISGVLRSLEIDDPRSSPWPSTGRPGFPPSAGRRFP